MKTSILTAAAIIAGLAFISKDPDASVVAGINGTDKTIYLNMKTSDGVETVDEFSPEPGQSYKEFRSYVRKMIDEYRLAGMYVYSSSRCTKDWKNK